LTRDLAATTLGYSVNRQIATFDNGFDAWTYFQGPQAADILLADVNIPEMSGLELLKRIKAEFPHKKCIVMSSQPKDEDAARELGADAFIGKPFKPNALFEIVRQFVVRNVSS
jgi:chemosensory pili system protein ChpA (sensor histidine kinase/response regulator)